MPSDYQLTEYFWGINYPGKDSIVCYVASDGTAHQILENPDPEKGPVGAPIGCKPVDLPADAEPIRGSIPVFNPVAEAIEKGIREAS